MADETRAQLAHLFRRAAFGARPDEIDYYVLRGYAAAVDDLVSGRPIAGAPPIPTAPTSGSTSTADQFKRSELQKAQGRWIREMVSSSTPLVERMTLFLADHVATAFSPADRISVIDMEAHLSIIRGHALGSFSGLLHKLLEDPAFAIWLDSHRNRRGAPNENLARELFELFTLGPGNYTEMDVREAARSLTGYKLNKAEMLMPGADGSATNRLTFDSRLHDYGEKLVLGVRGTFMPHDVIDIALGHPAAAQFVAEKLVAAFQSPAPNPVLVGKVATALANNNWSLGPAMKALFMAPEFRAATSRSNMVKSPAEFVGGAMRALKRTEFDTAAALAAAAGQSLFEPPSVAGWTPNHGWLATGSVLGRYNAAATIGQLHATAPVPGFIAPATTEAWANLFGLSELSSATTQAIEAYRRETVTRTDKVREAGMITLIVSSPEFSLA